MMILMTGPLASNKTAQASFFDVPTVLINVISKILPTRVKPGAAPSKMMDTFLLPSGESVSGPTCSVSAILKESVGD